MDDKYFLDCISILHFFMVFLLKTFTFEDASQRLLERIIEMRGKENEMVVNAVLHFYEDCRNLEPNSTRIVKLFVVDFMITMFGAYDMPDEDLVKFMVYVEKLHDHNDYLIRQIKESERFENFFILFQYVERPDLQRSQSNSANPPQQGITWSRRMADLIFDVRGYPEAVKRRLQSAALFVIENGTFFSPPPSKEEYIEYADRCCQKFMGAKLMAFNMIGLEIFLQRKNKNRDVVSRQRMESLVDAYMNILLKANRGKSKYPRGTKLSVDMFQHFRGICAADDNDDICVICQDPLSAKPNTWLHYCDHVYHADCTTEWLTRSRTCPTCRVVMMPPWCEFPGWIWNVDRLQRFLNRVY